MSDDASVLFPSDSRLIELPAGSKRAREDYRESAVPPADFLGLSGNVGMVLDNQYLLVDIDAPNAEESKFLASRLDREAPTRLVQTPRGGSHRIFLLPKGFTGTNAVLNRPDGSPYADLKTLGYAVGPGSQVNGKYYVLANALPPAPAPSWLLEKVVKAHREAPSDERHAVPRGEHDHALASLAGYLRGRQGFSASAIARILEAVVDGGYLADMDERDPYTAEAFGRIARSMGQKPAASDPLAGVNLGATLRTSADTELSWDPTRWLVHGFVPEAELVMLYGKSGVGKTSFASWLAVQAVRKGLRVAVALREEPFKRFNARAVYGGLTDRTMLLDMCDEGRALRFPSGAAALRTLITENDLQMVYLDSIYDHFDHLDAGNAAEKARAGLTPLAEMAQELGCLIVATYHENKMGQALGSVEMQNVPRVTLKLTRGKKGPMKARVAWSNFDKPDYLVTFDALDITHEGQLEENRAGELKQATIKVVRQGADVPIDEDDGMEEFVDENGELETKHLANVKERREQTIDY